MMRSALPVILVTCALSSQANTSEFPLVGSYTAPPFMDDAMVGAVREAWRCDITLTTPRMGPSQPKSEGEALQRFLFVHVPKTGGSSIEHAFGYRKDHRLAYDRVNELNRTLGFSIVRNPFDRMLSWYRFCISGFGIHSRIPLPTAHCTLAREISIRNETHAINFENWLTAVLLDPEYAHTWVTTSTAVYLTNPHGQFIVDVILRYEEFDDPLFWRFLERLFGQPVEKSHENGSRMSPGASRVAAAGGGAAAAVGARVVAERSREYAAVVAALSTPHYSLAYTPRSRALVAAAFEVDLTVFHYVFENRSEAPPSSRPSLPLPPPGSSG